MADDTRFYYAHLGENADQVHPQIHLVDDADRKMITKSGLKSLPWVKGKWHRVRIDRSTATVDITVWLEGGKVLTAKDMALGKGRIGLGSSDDLASFRKLNIAPSE